MNALNHQNQIRIAFTGFVQRVCTFIERKDGSYIQIHHFLTDKDIWHAQTDHPNRPAKNKPHFCKCRFSACVLRHYVKQFRLTTIRLFFCKVCDIKTGIRSLQSSILR